MSRQLISLVEIADVICEDVDDKTKRYRSFIMRHLATCYRNLSMFVSDETEVETFIAPAGNVVNMPCNFIYETKVGLRYGDRTVFLDKNYDDTGSNAMVMNQTQALDYINGVFRGDINSEECHYFYNYRGELICGYGRGIKCDGLYTVDRKNGTIFVGSVVPKGSEIVVEYKADGVAKGLKMVPIEMYDCLYHYGLWKFYFKRSDGRYRQSANDYDVAYYQLESLYKFVPISYIVKLFNQEMHTIDGRL